MARLLTLLLALLPLTAAAQPLRPVTEAYTVEAGSATIADTYLSPLTYTGWHLALGYERLQAMRQDPERLVMQLRGNAGVSRALSPARNSLMWDATLRLDWSMLRRWRLPYSITLAAGGEIALDGGALYQPRNGNNPVSARAALTLGATAMALWNTRIARLPLTVRYQPRLPLVGAFFAPQYGELYYEIWLGDRGGLVHAAWPGNRFAMENLVTVDLRLGGTVLRIGYHNSILSSSVNHITTRSVTHAAVLGIALQSITLSSRHSAADAISAYY